MTDVDQKSPIYTEEIFHIMDCLCEHCGEGTCSRASTTEEVYQTLGGRTAIKTTKTYNGMNKVNWI